MRAFRAFPWRGGWSAVGFYEQLRIAVPPKHRPRLVAIEYASPGFMDLGGPIEVLTAIEKTVKLVCIRRPAQPTANTIKVPKIANY